MRALAELLRKIHDVDTRVPHVVAERTTRPQHRYAAAATLLPTPRALPAHERGGKPPGNRGRGGAGDGGVFDGPLVGDGGAGGPGIVSGGGSRTAEGEGEIGVASILTHRHRAVVPRTRRGREYDVERGQRDGSKGPPDLTDVLVGVPAPGERVDRRAVLGDGRGGGGAHPADGELPLGRRPERDPPGDPARGGGIHLVSLKVESVPRRDGEREGGDAGDRRG